MAISKLTDFLDQLKLASITSTMLSAGLAPPLCKLLAERLIPHDANPRKVPASVAELVARCQTAVDTDTMVNLHLDPTLARVIVDYAQASTDAHTNVSSLKARIDAMQEDQRRTVRERDDAVIERDRLHNEVQRLEQMARFIAAKLPALNTIPRVEGAPHEAALDDISRAIDLRNDPTTEAPIPHPDADVIDTKPRAPR